MRYTPNETAAESSPAAGVLFEAARAATSLLVFQPEAQKVRLDGRQRQGRAMVRQRPILRIRCDETFEAFPFLKEALFIWRLRHQERQFRGVSAPTARCHFLVGREISAG